MLTFSWRLCSLDLSNLFDGLNTFTQVSLTLTYFKGNRVVEKENSHDVCKMCVTTIEMMYVKCMKQPYKVQTLLDQ